MSGQNFAPKWEMKPVKPNLFYYNVEAHQPSRLATFVHNELWYFKSHLNKSIRSMNVERYGLNWEKDEAIRYEIRPRQRIKVIKPRKRILIYTPPDDFSANIPLQREDGSIIDYISFDLQDEGIIIILSERTQLDPNISIFYKMQPIQWKSLSSGFGPRFEYLEDREGNKFRVLKRKKGSGYYELDIEDLIPPDTELFIKGVQIDYKERTIRTLTGINLLDKNGSLNHIVISGSNFIIETSRQIEGILTDENQRNYDYKKIKEREKRRGIWIALHEPKTLYEHADEDQGSIVDLFFELLSAAFEYEIWEKPDVKKLDTSSRIKIITQRREEGRLLLKREPTSKIIFPPKNDYQLRMQKQAIETLLYRPAPAHRNLLKLFEAYEDADWEPLSDEYSEEMINWRFLVRKDREGTLEQQNFVIKCLNTPDFVILEGPPGSGKTTAITELIFQLLKKRKRVLLSASTHVAIDNVIEMLSNDLEPEANLKDYGIVPLRIGHEDNISEEVKPYQIDNRIKDITKVLETEEWFIKLTEENQEGYLNELVIWSSNLVCGTTIGVLQYPHFKQVRRDYVTPEFDYVVIDEASKTTFQEFLVPAIHAKKWIIVGDIRQLSPYTDTLHVRVNLDGILGDKARETAQLLFLKLIFDLAMTPEQRRKHLNFLPFPMYLYVDEFNVIKAIYDLLLEKIAVDNEKPSNEQRMDHLKFSFITSQDLYDANFDNIDNLSAENLESRKFTLLDKDVIFVDKEIYHKRWRDIPINHILIYPNNPLDSDNIEFRHSYWLKINHYRAYEYSLPRGRWVNDPEQIKEDIFAALSKNWAGELAWRMKRVYELQLSQNVRGGSGSIGYYHACMRALLPTDRAENRRIWNQIKRIAQICYLPIITSLQEGVSQYYRIEADKTVMSSGFPPPVKSDRHQLLSYQHRMHWEISKLPRKLFYEKIGALMDVSAITDEGIRDWTYDAYGGRRLVWKHVGGEHVHVRKNTNEEEAKAVFKELENFFG